MITYKGLEFIIDVAMDRYHSDVAIRAVYGDIDAYVAAEVACYLIEKGVEVE